MNSLVKKTLSVIILAFSLYGLSAYSMDIFEASSKGNIARVRALIATGTNVNQHFVKRQNVLFGGTPLHCAAWHGHQEVVRMLLNARANLNLQDGAGETPLHMAVFMNHKLIVKDLLVAGANINIKNYDGNGVLTIAQWKGFHAIVDLITSQTARAQMTALLGAAVHKRLGSNSPAQLLIDMQPNGLAHILGTYVLEAAKEDAYE